MVTEQRINPQSTFPTIVEILRSRVVNQSIKQIDTFLLDKDGEKASLTYGALDQQARAIGAVLQASCLPGDRVLLLLPPGLAYIAAFFGCLYAGVIAVPAYPPRINRSLSRLQAIVTDAQATLALTTNSILSHVQHRFNEAPELKRLRWLESTSIEGNMGNEWRMPGITGDTLAFLQYTSGSTAAPKGVMVTHANLLHNSSLLYSSCGHSSESHMVSWLPPYHDLGLVFGVVQPLYGSFPVTLLSPFAFAQHPLRWLEAVSAFKATTTSAPTFAYDLCVDKVTPEQLKSLDLSSLQIALIGVERVRRATLERFAATFGPCGLRKNIFNVCYGLAEATLDVTFSQKGKAPIIYSVQKTGFEQNRVIVAEPAHEGSVELVSCGRVVGEQRIIIVDPHTGNQCQPEEIGEIWASGSSIAQGYWNRPEETQKTFRAYVQGHRDGPFLRTGDLGFISEGEIFVTGRIKDLIKIRGRNHYPQDIELTVEQSHPVLRSGCSAVSSIDIQEEERLVVVQEVKRHYQEVDLERSIEAIRQAVVHEHEVTPYAIALIRHGSILKTSSGKIQHYACKAAFLNDTFPFLKTVIFNDIPYDESQHTLTLDTLLEAEEDARRSLLESYLREQAAHYLRTRPSEIDTQTSLSFLGFDSLSGLELKGDIEDAFGVILPAGYFPLGPNISTLTTEILAQLPESLFSPEAALRPTANQSSEYPLSV